MVKVIFVQCCTCLDLLQRSFLVSDFYYFLPFKFAIFDLSELNKIMSSTNISLWSTPRNLLRKQKSLIEPPTHFRSHTQNLFVGNPMTNNNVNLNQNGHKRTLHKQFSVDQNMSRTWTITNNNNSNQQPQQQQQQPRTTNYTNISNNNNCISNTESGLKIIANNLNGHHKKRHQLGNGGKHE